MSKDKKCIPALRFPEFKEDGGWLKNELSTLGELINGLTYNPNDVRTKGLLVLRSSNIQNGLIDLKDCVYVRPDIKGANLSQPNDILVCVRNGSKALIGKNAIIPKDIPLATHGAFMTVFRAKLPEFVFQLFQTDAYNKQVKADLGATINSINGKNLLKYEFLIPENLSEQRKVASCFSSLDEVIAGHSQKLDILKDHKKGLMQTLFPQKGEKVPKYRFKEFEKDGEWEEKKLGTVAEIITGNTPSTADTINYNGVNLFVSPADINDNRYISQTKTTLSDIGFSKTRQIKANSVLFVCIGSTIGKVAQNNFKCATNQQINSLIPYEGHSNDFLYSVLEYSAPQISEIAGIQAVPIINKTQFSSVKLLFPKLQEQQKIASCLSELDELITAQAETIEQLKLHKKGLMQDLFPKMTE